MLFEKPCEITEKELLGIVNKKAVSGKVSVGDNAHSDCRSSGTGEILPVKRSRTFEKSVLFTDV